MAGVRTFNTVRCWASKQKNVRKHTRHDRIERMRMEREKWERILSSHFPHAIQLHQMAIGVVHPVSFAHFSFTNKHKHSKYGISNSDFYFLVWASVICCHFSRQTVIFTVWRHQSRTIVRREKRGKLQLHTRTHTLNNALNISLTAL